MTTDLAEAPVEHRDGPTEFKYAEHLGRSFGGYVHELPLETLHEFHKLNWDAMSEEGQNSFLRSMGIPVGFFKKRNSVLREDLIVDTKEDVRKLHQTDSLLALEIDGLIKHVAPKNDALGWKDPQEVLGLDDHFWQICGESLGAGVVRFMHMPGEIEPTAGDYYVTAFFTLPIFYSAPFKLDMGMFKLICTNGWIDEINSKSMKFNHLKFKPEIFQEFVGCVSEAAKAMEGEYNTFMEALAGITLSPSEAQDLVCKKMRDPETGKHPLPGKLVSAVASHCDALIADNAVPQNSPQEIRSHLDALDALTYYSQHVDKITMKGRDRADAESFRWFYANCVGLGHVQVQSVKLEHYLNLRVGSTETD